MPRAGTFRDLVDIQQDSSSDGSPTEDFSGDPLYESVPCEIEATGGNEYVRGRQIQAGIDYIVTMHYLEGVTQHMRLLVTGGMYDGRTLNIEAWKPSLSRGRAYGMELYCKELATP